MNERPLQGLTVVLAFIGAILGTSSAAFGFAAESFLAIERAIISIDEDDEELSSELVVEGTSVPANGTEGAFGYGILTGEEGGDTMLVAHTHRGVLDSEDQRFIADPTWHTHLLRLGDADECEEEDQGIVDITWQSPGEVTISNDMARISDIPTDEFEGWDSITGEPLTMTLGEDVSKVISFKIDPVFDEDDGELEALCITDIRSAEEEEEVNRN